MRRKFNQFDSVIASNQALSLEIEHMAKSLSTAQDDAIAYRKKIEGRFSQK